MGRRPKFPKKDAKIIGSLAHEKAVELIFPKGSLDYTTPKGKVLKWSGIEPPKTWRCWQPQKTGSEESRELDAQIEEIIRDARIAGRLRENNGPCPYYTARWRIVAAAENASAWTIWRDMVEKLSKDREKRLNIHSKSLAKIRDSIFSTDLLGTFRYPDGHIETASRDIFTIRAWRKQYENDIKYITSLNQVIAAINDRASFEQTIRGAGSPGCRSFLIGELARVWSWLTGKPAAGSPGGPFSRFVEAVFNCFGLEAPEPGEIRRVIERVRIDE